MANEQDARSRLLLEQELNSIFEKNLELQKEQQKLLSKQLETQLNINKAIAGNQQKVSSATDAQQELQRAIAGTNDDIVRNTEAQRDFEVAVRESSAEQEKQNNKMEMAGKIAGGFSDAITGTISGLFGMGKAVGSLVGSLFNLTKAILSVPLDILDWFVQQAKELPDDAEKAIGGGGAANTALKEAMEETRKSFGDLASGPGKAVVDMYKNISKAGNMLSGTGLRLNQIFGKGVDGQAAIMKYATEMATGLGVAFMNLSDDMKKNAGYYTLVGKSFNLSGEELSTLQKRAYNMGQDPKKAIEEFSKTALQLGKALNVDTKMLAKGMVEMTAAFPAFAAKGAKAIGTATAHLHKLGIEVKDLKGMFDKFDSFDSAAESASTLSQTLGVQVDAMKLVQEQDPTKKLELMRNAFRAAGKDISQMTSAERKLALETTGMSEAMFDAAMGEGNKKKLLNETEKAAQAATKAQMDSTKAMKEMAKAIQRLMPSGGGGGGGGAEVPNVRKDFDGFFDAIKKGFADGAANAKPVKDVIENIGKSLKMVYKAAYEVGDAFIKYFPGVKDMLRGIAEFFDPSKLTGPIYDMKNAVITFFKDLDKMDPAAAIDKLIRKVSQIFSESSTGGLGKIKEGFDKFTSVLSGIAAKIVRELMLLMTNAFKGLTELISNPSSFLDMAGTAKAGAEGFFTPIAKQIKEKWPMLKEAMTVFFDKLYEEVLKPLLKKLAPYIAAYFGLQLAMNMAPILIGSLANSFLQKQILTKVLSRAGIASGGPADANVVSGFRKIMGDAEGKMLPTFSRMANSMKRAFSTLSQSASSSAVRAGGRIKTAFGNALDRVGSVIPPSIQRFTSRLGRGFSTMPGQLGGQISRAGSSIMNRLRGSMGGGGAGVALGKAAGALGIVMTVAEGLKEGFQKYKETGDVAEASREFGASVLSGLTLGIVDKETFKDISSYLEKGMTSLLDTMTFGTFKLSEKVRDADAQAKNIENIRKKQSEGFLSDAQSQLELQDKALDHVAEKYAEYGEKVFTTQEQFEKMAKEGTKVGPDKVIFASLKQAAADSAKVEAQVKALEFFKEKGKGDIDVSSEEFKKKRQEMLFGLQEKYEAALKAKIEEKSKEKLERDASKSAEALAAQEEDKRKRIELAKTLPETIKDVTNAIKKLPSLEKELDKAMENFKKNFDLEKFKIKIQSAADKVAEIFPIIEDAFTKAAEKMKSATSTTESIKNVNVTLAEVVGVIEKVRKISKDIPTADKLKEALVKVKNLGNFMTILTADVGPDGETGALKTFTDKVKAPDLSTAILAMNNLGALTNSAKSALSNIKEYEKLIDEVQKIAKKPAIDAGKATAVAQVIAGLTSAPGGKVEVTHNIPNVKIEIKVDMNADQVAKAIVKSPVGTISGNNQYFGTSPTRPNVT